MKIVWQFESADIAKVKSFFNEHADNPFVKSRISTNLRVDKPPISKDDFWDRMVGCLLTNPAAIVPNSTPGPSRRIARVDASSGLSVEGISIM